MKDLWRVGVLLAGVVVSLPMLALSRLLIRYDRLSRGRHAAVIRRALPWRRTAWVGPTLPLVVLTEPAAGALTSSPVVGGVVHLGWFCVAVMLAEVYSVCLHREAWIAAFEPWFLPDNARPLGAAPPSVDDRRLHYLVRIQSLYSVSPVAVGLVLGWGASSGIAVAATLLFLAKFFGHAHSDYEVFYHWHLHTKALHLVGHPGRSRVVDYLLDWYLGPLHGYLPNVYRADHLLIHHPENSGPADIHSPLPYRRTSLLEFGVFALRTCGSLLLGHRIAGHRRCRPDVRRRLLMGVVGYWLAMIFLLAVGSLFAFWLLFLAVHRAVSAARSQYEWHGLIDPARPRDPMASTMMWVSGAGLWRELVARATTAARPDAPGRGAGAGLMVAPPRRHRQIPEPGTDWAFFDNNHLLHHLHPKAHYRDYPELLMRRLPDIVAARAVVLDLAGLDTFAFDCWSANLSRLSRTLIAPDDVDREAFLRERLAPAVAARSPYGRLCETRAGRCLDRFLARLLGLAYR